MKLKLLLVKVLIIPTILVVYGPYFEPTLAYPPNLGHVKQLFETNQRSKCNLTGEDFSNANLSGANLRGAQLYSSNFNRANLSRADLSMLLK